MAEQQGSLIGQVIGKLSAILLQFAFWFTIFEFGRHVGKLETTPEEIVTVFEDTHTYCFKYESDPKVYCSSKGIKDLWDQR